MKKHGEGMGIFHVTLRVANPGSPSRGADIQLLVDTGATLSAVPRSILQSIGVEPGMTRYFLVADGRRVRRETGLVLATMDGVTMPIPVMFADEGDALGLGATALEILGFTVDPVERKLVPRDLFAL